MNFDRLMTGWGYSASRKICDAIRIYGPSRFDEAKKDFDDVTLWVIQDQGGWEKMCELKMAEPPTLRTIWARRAKEYVETVKFPEI